MEIAIRGVATAAGASAAYLAGRMTGRPARAGTVGLVGLVGAQLGQTVAAGARDPLVLLGSAASWVALVAAVQTPGVSQFFGCTPLGPVGWATGTAAAAAATIAAHVSTPAILPRITGREAERRSEETGSGEHAAEAAHDFLHQRGKGQEGDLRGDQSEELLHADTVPEREG